MGNVCHVLEEFGDLAGFPFELGGVVDVLVLAASAFTEEVAFRFAAVWGGF